MFRLRLWTNKPDRLFHGGEKPIEYVESERDGYLKLDYFQANGTVVHLAPNMFSKQAFIKANKIYSFGHDESSERFFVRAPYGTEVIKAIAGVQPFDAYSDEEVPLGNSREYLHQLQGLTGVAATSSVELTTESRALIDYKKASSQYLFSP